MTALEYFEKQLQKNRKNYEREVLRNAPMETIMGIIDKISYYEQAVEALKQIKM